jgi:DNA ligase-1
MRSFATLFTALDETTKTIEKVAALVRYFSEVRPAEAAWALFFLSGRRLPMPVPRARLRSVAVDVAQVPPWLFDECYDAVGDLAETIALIIPKAEAESDRPLDEWVHDWLVPLRDLDERSQRQRLTLAWRQMSSEQVFVWNKLLTGGFRVGVSQQLVSRALAHVSGLSISIVTHRLMGTWSPTPEFFNCLVGTDDAEDDASKPYPFFLAHPLEDEPQALGALAAWHAEWKWDGIRCLLLRRRGQTFLWSRGEDLVTDRYPEIARVGDRLTDGIVLDGEILPFKDSRPLSFLDLQRRITRKSLSKKLLADVPVVYMAYDLLEENGVDRREAPFHERRGRLEAIIAQTAEPALQISTRVAAATWEELDVLRHESRQRGVEGLMLKRLDSPYRVGRVRGDWWKWKIQPFTLDAVLMYAQPGNGKRAGLFTDYTFGLWDGPQLVPFAKAYSGLTDDEIAKVDAFVRRNTLEKFGPVRTVKPQLVFEIGFESIQASNRHRSGIAVRFPRMLRWRVDKPAAEADTLEAARRMVPTEAARTPAGRKSAKRDIETPLFDNL